MNIQDSTVEELVRVLTSALKTGSFSTLERIVPEFEDILALGTSQFTDEIAYKQALKEYFDYVYKTTDIDQFAGEKSPNAEVLNTEDLNTDILNIEIKNAEIKNIKIKNIESTDTYELLNIDCDIESKDRLMHCELAGALYFHQKDSLKIMHYLLTEKIDITNIKPS